MLMSLGCHYKTATKEQKRKYCECAIKIDAAKSPMYTIRWFLDSQDVELSYHLFEIAFTEHYDHETIELLLRKNSRRNFPTPNDHILRDFLPYLSRYHLHIILRQGGAITQSIFKYAYELRLYDLLFEMILYCKDFVEEEKEIIEEVLKKYPEPRKRIRIFELAKQYNLSQGCLKTLESNCNMERLD